MRFFLITLIFAVSVAACSDPVEKKHYTQIEIGNTKIQAQLSVTPQDHIRGLQFVKQLPNNQGMLFIYGAPSVLSHWMKDTMIPLDIIWIDPHKKIIKISANVPICLRDPCQIYRSDAVAKYALEVNAGFAAQHQIHPGMSVYFQ